MDISLLEDRLSAKPKSPLFARLAACYEAEGRFDEAIDLCTRGLKEFPDYPTGHLVLGRCYEATGRNVEALIEYRRVLRFVPDNPTVRRMLERIEQREQEAFHTFAEERLKQLRQQQESSTIQEYVGQARGEGRPGDDEEIGPPDQSDRKIVTATLAEIYATQGEFREAIQVYRRLAAERPERSTEISGRIAELEGLARARQAELRH